MGLLEEGQTLVGEAWKKDVTRRLDEYFEKLGEHEDRFSAGNERFQRTDARMTEIAEKVDANTVITTRIEKNTAEILAIFAAFRGFVKVSGWVGTVVKWVGGILLAAGIIYWTWKTGQLPRKEG